MKVVSFLGAMGFGIFAGVWLAELQHRRAPRSRLLNINQASQHEIMSVLGLNAELAEQIVEHRPYPSKIDLLGRMVVPEEIYVAIKDRITYKVA
jgi:DNA uptake protein ComE-like DNA-binding protein